MSVADERTLLGVELFDGLLLAQQREIAACCTWRRYGAGQEIVAQNSRSTDVYFILGGRARATLYDRSGTVVTFSDLGSGKSFGDLAAIDGGLRSVTVVALEDCLVVAMSAPAFRDVVGRYPPVALKLLRQLAALVRALTERVVEFSTLDVEARIHSELLRLAETGLGQGKTVTVAPAPTHADLASRVSTHREAVTKTLNRLKRDGLIEMSRRGLVIPDLDRFRRWVQERRPGER